jgi:hypothetical protein
VTIDFLRSREFGGLMLAWEAGRAATGYAVLASADGRTWRPLARRVRGGPGLRDHLFLPDADARFLRLELAGPAGGAGFGLRELRVAPLAASSSRNAFFEGIAKDAPRGNYPRSLVGEPCG